MISDGYYLNQRFSNYGTHTTGARWYSEGYMLVREKLGGGLVWTINTLIFFLMPVTDLILFYVMWKYVLNRY